MKNEILQIAYSLEKGIIDEETAKQELCVLLSVSHCSKGKLAEEFQKGYEEGYEENN